MLLACGDDFAPRSPCKAAKPLYRRVKHIQSAAGVVGVAAGRRHSVVVTAAGAVLTHGDHSRGQLGVRLDDVGRHGRAVTLAASPSEEEKKADDANDVNDPAWQFSLVTALSSKHVVAVRAGAFSCYALGRDGSLFAWGGGSHGCLGLGGVGDRSVPRPLQLHRHKVQELSAGGFHCVALTTGVWWFASRRRASEVRGRLSCDTCNLGTDVRVCKLRRRLLFRDSIMGMRVPVEPFTWLWLGC